MTDEETAPARSAVNQGGFWTPVLIEASFLGIAVGNLTIAPVIRGYLWPALAFVMLVFAAASVPHRKFRHSAAVAVAVLSVPPLALWHAVHQFRVPSILLFWLQELLILLILSQAAAAAVVGFGRLRQK